MPILVNHDRGDDPAAALGDEDGRVRIPSRMSNVFPRIVPRAGDTRRVPDGNDLVDVQVLDVTDFRRRAGHIELTGLHLSTSAGL